MCLEPMDSSISLSLATAAMVQNLWEEQTLAGPPSSATAECKQNIYICKNVQKIINMKNITGEEAPLMDRSHSHPSHAWPLERAPSTDIYHHCFSFPRHQSTLSGWL